MATRCPKCNYDRMPVQVGSKVKLLWCACKTDTKPVGHACDKCGWALNRNSQIHVVQGVFLCHVCFEMKGNV